MKNSTAKKTERLPCLDFIRVAAICLLVFYHTAMVYVPDWGFHYKVPLEDGIWLQSLMLVINPWRMGLLWFVSGTALAFVLMRYPIKSLLIKRSLQLLLPLLVGVLLVVPIQLFAEMHQAGYSASLGEFMYAFYIEPKSYFIHYQSGIWPHIDVNHLWFLRSLWKFTMVLILISPLTQLRLIDRTIDKLAEWSLAVIVITAVAIFLINIMATGESVRELYGLVLFVVGFLLGKRDAFWKSLSKHLRPLALVTLLSMVMLQIYFLQVWTKGDSVGVMVETLGQLTYLSNQVLPVFTILAIGYRYMNQPRSWITRSNTYVYPLYVIHQSIIVAVAFYTGKTNYSLLARPESQLTFTLLVSAMLCVICLAAIGKFDLLRVGFGMRLKSGEDPYKNKVLTLLALLFISPLIFALLF